MATNTKIHNGIRYNIVHREFARGNESPWYWQGTDGSTLELTEAEEQRRLPKVQTIID